MSSSSYGPRIFEDYTCLRCGVGQDVEDGTERCTECGAIMMAKVLGRDKKIRREREAWPYGPQDGKPRYLLWVDEALARTVWAATQFHLKIVEKVSIDAIEDSNVRFLTQAAEVMRQVVAAFNEEGLTVRDSDARCRQCGAPWDGQRQREQQGGGP